MDSAQVETGDDVRLADEYMRTKGREAEQLEGERETTCQALRFF